jgi:hypothetical protein
MILCLQLLRMHMIMTLMYAILLQSNIWHCAGKLHPKQRSITAIRRQIHQSIHLFAESSEISSSDGDLPVLESSHSSQLLNKHIPKGQDPSEEDMLAFRRQLGYDASHILAVPKLKCKHGFPQAFIQAPIGHRISSGMVSFICWLIIPRASLAD